MILGEHGPWFHHILYFAFCHLKTLIFEAFHHPFFCVRSALLFPDLTEVARRALLCVSPLLSFFTTPKVGCVDAIKMCGVSLSPLLVLEKYYKKITQKETKISLKITEKDCWRILGKRVQNKRKKTCQNQEKITRQEQLRVREM